MTARWRDLFSAKLQRTGEGEDTRGAVTSGFEVFLTERANDINEARLRHLALLHLDLQGARVLEVGAGIGLHTAFFERLNCTVLSTDGRLENVRELRRRYPTRAARVLDLDAPRLPNDIGEFDIVYCYDTLCHLQRPAEAIERLGAVCKRLLLLETLVTSSLGSTIRFVRENAASHNEGMRGLGCRPTRQWVLDQLRMGFGHAYVTKTQPLHDEFPLDWIQTQPGMNCRAVFVGSKTPLANHRLSEALLQQQTYDIDHSTETWVDVGAHLGELSFEQARDAPWRIVYAFEPNIRLASRVFGRVPNYLVVPMAVSSRDGFARFHLNASDATSSLNPFHGAGLNAWIGNEHLQVEASVWVPTIRLDTFLEQMRVKKVDHLKIDAQGSDYDVLLSLGARLRDVASIELEVAITREQLYESAHAKEEVVAFLTGAGFRLQSQKRQSHDQEENLSFVRPAFSL